MEKKKKRENKIPRSTPWCKYSAASQIVRGVHQRAKFDPQYLSWNLASKWCCLFGNQGSNPLGEPWRVEKLPIQFSELIRALVAHQFWCYMLKNSRRRILWGRQSALTSGRACVGTAVCGCSACGGTGAYMAAPCVANWKAIKGMGEFQIQDENEK